MKLRLHICTIIIASVIMLVGCQPTPPATGTIIPTLPPPHSPIRTA